MPRRVNLFREPVARYWYDISYSSADCINIYRYCRSSFVAWEIVCHSIDCGSAQHFSQRCIVESLFDMAFQTFLRSEVARLRGQLPVPGKFLSRCCLHSVFGQKLGYSFCLSIYWILVNALAVGILLFRKWLSLPRKEYNEGLNEFIGNPPA